MTKDDNRWWFIDKSNNVASAEYQDISFYNGYTAIVKNNGKWHILSMSKPKTIIEYPEQFDAIKTSLERSATGTAFRKFEIVTSLYGAEHHVMIDTSWSGGITAIANKNGKWGIVFIDNYMGVFPQTDFVYDSFELLPEYTAIVLR